MINVGTELDTAFIQKEMQALSGELKEKAVKAGLAKVAASGVKLMKQYAPHDKGDLKKSIRRKQLPKLARARLNVRQDKSAVIVGPNYNGMGRVANMLEGGTKKHVIEPRKELSAVQGFLRSQGMRGKKTGALTDGGKFFAKKVNHPGVRAYRFIKKTDQANAGKAEGLFYKGVSDYLKRHNK